MSRADDLLTLLQATQPQDAREKDFLARMVALTRSSQDPFSRLHFSPGHFTASAFVVHPQDSTTALIFHGKLHRWLQPGGHVDPEDRNVESAARREIQEELGLSDLATHPSCPGIFDVDIHPIPARGEEPAHHHFDVRFLFVASDPTLRTGSDAHDSRWVALRDVHELESDASVLRALAKMEVLLSSGQL